MKRLTQGLSITIITLLALFLIEAGLRLGGYGHSSRLYESRIIEGKKVYINNIFYTAKYFTPELIRTPFPIVVDKSKEKNTVRIVIAGESAALGDPDYSFGFGRILEVMLKDAYPDIKFEIINTSITAVNSHVILPIIKETKKKLNPDIFLLFIGNNEVIGPFGPNSLFSGYTSSRRFIRLSIALNSTRLGMLARNIRFGLSGRELPDHWDGMEMFLNYRVEPGDQQIDVVRSNFRRNMEDICRIAAKDAKVILSTVPVNLRDCPPFYSVNPSMLDESLQEDFRKSFQNALLLADAGVIEPARQMVEKTLKLDAMSADAHFLCAKLLYSMGAYEDAASHYKMALENDALKFRADNHVNTIIREVYQKFRNPDNVSLLDMEYLIGAYAENGIPGRDLFLEHVHFNFFGNYLVASYFKLEIEKQLGLHNPKAEIQPVDYYKTRLAYTAYEAYRVHKETLNRLGKPPFMGRINNEQELIRVKEKIAAIQRSVPSEEEYKYALSYTPDDWLIKYKYALFKMVTGDFGESVLALLNEVRYSVPQNPTVEFNIGFFHENRGDHQRARIHYKRAIDIFPNYGEAHKRYAQLHQH